MTVERLPLFEGANSTIAKDLKLNLEKLINGESTISAVEASLVALALATSIGHQALREWALHLVNSSGEFDEQAIQEVREAAAINGMLNIYYRFRHFVLEPGSEHEAAYGAAKLRMQSLAKPVIGKVRFEKLAFALALLNGCQMCAKAHEAVLLDHGVSVDEAHDIARLTAVIYGTSKLL